MIYRTSTGCLFLIVTIIAPQWSWAAGADPGKNNVVSQRTYPVNFQPASVRVAARADRLSAAEKEAIQNTPIQYRPTRLGHFYGNTVRRVYHRRSARGVSKRGSSRPARRR